MLKELKKFQKDTTVPFEKFRFYPYFFSKFFEHLYRSKMQFKEVMNFLKIVY